MSVQKWHNEQLAEITVGALKKNGFDAEYFTNSKDAVDSVLSLITSGMTIGFGGSATVKGLNVAEKAAELGAVILDHNVPELSAEEKLEVRRKQLTSDIFLCSSNALTLDGYLVNVDGTGNRVAAMSFGPKKVIVLAGVNKICKDTEAGFARIELSAAPKNTNRLNLKTPCATTGVCADCNSEKRICRIYSVLKKKPSAADFKVIIVGETLGY
ncbi:lactate utilization protein [Metallumcola ferriviriculae]|uniref:Lactate utilization protein n=1 Tax=Metallumcola ferriviriculae TaxID=3039180 RepID=A0AAU0UUH7_9FIRM|nr:lactate utilization protein [Desulfitibacteraceae bacterium MK1]